MTSLFLGGAQLFFIDLQHAPEFEVLEQLFEFFTHRRVLLEFFVQQEKVALHAAQNHPFQAVQVVEAIAGGFSHGGHERLPGIFPHQAEQLAQGRHHQLATVLFQSADIISYLWSGLEDGLFFGVSIAARRGCARGSRCYAHRVGSRSCPWFPGSPRDDRSRPTGTEWRLLCSAP